MTNSELLKKAIEESGLLKSAILERMGIKSYATLRAKIENESEFTASEMNKLGEILNLSADQREAIFFAKNAE
jgi:hypothetical protein